MTDVAELQGGGGTVQQRGVYDHGSINHVARPLYEDLALSRDGQLPYAAAPATGDVAAIRNSSYDPAPSRNNNINNNNDGHQQNQYTPAPSKQL
jgi:hypothetical protein